MNGGDCGGSCACSGPAAPLVQVSETVKGTVTAKPVLSVTKHLTDIEVDYGHENLDHSKEVRNIAIKYEEIKEENGARWRTPHRFESGIFSAKIKTPGGNTSGLNCSFYLSSLEGDKTQDEIDFEFLGKDKGIIQTNVYTQGTGNREEIHQLGFDSSQDFHEYAIHWSPTEILWFIDGVQVRKHERMENEAYPTKPCFCMPRCGMPGGSTMESGLVATQVVMSLICASIRTCKSLINNELRRASFIQVFQFLLVDCACFHWLLKALFDDMIRSNCSLLTLSSPQLI